MPALLAAFVVTSCGSDAVSGPDASTSSPGAASPPSTTTATTDPATTDPVTRDPATTDPATTDPAPGAPVLGGTPMTLCAVALAPAWCGTLAVPEDRAAADGRAIDLRVVVVPRLDEAADGMPLYALAGGPGGAASSDLGWMITTFAGIHETSDIVLVDQRGTGASNRLTVPPLPDLTGRSDDDARAALAAWWIDALAAADAETSRYTTTDFVDDLDAVRAALGHEQIDLLGASYGATAAQYYLARHGEHVRAAVLDGATLLEVPVFEHIAASSQQALDALVARCAADASCHTAFPEFGQEVAALLDELAARPVELPAAGPSAAPVTLDAADLALAIHHALLDATSSSLLPALVHAAAAGDWQQVAAAAGSAGATTDELLMSWVIRCSEPWASFDPENVARWGEGSYLADAQVGLARAQRLLCDTAPAGALPAVGAESLGAGAVDVPVLLLTGSADPQDPPANVAAAPERYPHSTLVVVPGQGHTVAHLGCVPTIVAEFLASADAASVDRTCIDAGGAAPPAFVLAL